MDANTYYINKHLAELDKEDRRESAIEARVEYLLKEDYCPYVYESFTEAMGEMHGSAFRVADIEKALKEEDFATLGKLIYQFNQEYWEKYARNSAEQWVDSPCDDY